MSSNTHLNNLLRRIADEQNYKNCDIKVLPVSTGGANYSSLLYTATINNDLHLFIKVLAIGKALQEQLNRYLSVTETEKAFYIDIKQAYEKIEDMYQVPVEHRLRLPKCYGSEVTPYIEVLVLENLVVKGFESFDRFKSMDWEYASKAVTELAKLHALSYAFQINDPKEFKRISDFYIADIITEDFFKKITRSGVKNVLNVLKDDEKSKFKKFWDEITLSKMTEYRKAQKLTVIAHGDFRPSNFMHRVLEDGSLEVVALDHQTYFLGSPITDLLSLIAVATDKPFRDQYNDKLIEFYYIQLSDALRRMDINPENTYSREDFYGEVKEKLPYGMIMATLALPFITVETEQAPELKADMNIEGVQITQVGALYPERMRDIVSDFVRWGALND